MVLSACNTGRGKQVQGEGLVGLTRGLMYAGSQRVVVSLWSVNDDGTKELMTLSFVGYSGDFPNPKKKGYEDLTAGTGWTASFETGCSIVGEKSAVLYHDCATAGGSSGGPLIAWVGEQPYIVALNNAEIKNLETNQDITNLAVKIDFLDKLAAGN
nr:CHAT domain-containing protein [Nostoc edaphicum]